MNIYSTFHLFFYYVVSKSKSNMLKNNVKYNEKISSEQLTTLIPLSKKMSGENLLNIYWAQTSLMKLKF